MRLFRRQDLFYQPLYLATWLIHLSLIPIPSHSTLAMTEQSNVPVLLVLLFFPYASVQMAPVVLLENKFYINHNPFWIGYSLSIATAYHVTYTHRS